MQDMIPPIYNIVLIFSDFVSEHNIVKLEVIRCILRNICTDKLRPADIQFRANFKNLDSLHAVFHVLPSASLDKQSARYHSIAAWIPRSKLQLGS